MTIHQRACLIEPSPRVGLLSRREDEYASGLASVLGRELRGSSCAVSDRALDLLAHAHDASHYLLQPQVLVTPTGVADVAAVMRACGRLGVPLTFRGGGTSLSGQALSDSVLLGHPRGVQARRGAR